ncbi:MAG: pilus assembly protein N-terminal domain-containing protein [Pirellulaceae bacterium]
MRDPKKMTNRSNRLRTVRSQFLRNARRKALAATLLLLSAPLAMGEEPRKSTATIALPPLPVQQVANHEIYGNPFCEPELQPIRDESVALASSEAQSAVRLKSAGAVIGLQPISSGKPVQIRPRTMKIETPPMAGIQDNPLIQSEHHLNEELVEVGLMNAPVDEMSMTPRGQLPTPRALPLPVKLDSSPEYFQPVDMPAERGPAATKSASRPQSVLVRPQADASIQYNRAEKALIVPARPASVNVEPELAELPAEMESVDEPVAIQTPAPITMEPALVAPPVVEEIAEAVTQIAELPMADPPTNPVYFSMSDSSGSKSEMLKVEQAIQSPSDRKAKVVQPVVIPSRDEEGIVALAEPVGLQPISEAEPQLSGREKLTISSDVAAMPAPALSGLPVVGQPVSANQSSGKALLSSHKRYRAPVAVDAPPVAISNVREQPTSAAVVSLQNQVKMAQPLSVDKNLTKTKEPELTTLHLTKAQVRSLTIGGMVRRVNVTNKNVCQAIATGPNQLKLIGTGNGVTRLVVWADTSGNSHTQARAFEIHVQDAVEATGGLVGTKTDTLNRSIYDAFPSANVHVQEFRDRLIVAGDCETEDEAKKIIRMVRKTCLIPVRDEIKVR